MLGTIYMYLGNGYPASLINMKFGIRICSKKPSLSSTTGASQPTQEKLDYSQRRSKILADAIDDASNGAQVAREYTISSKVDLTRSILSNRRVGGPLWYIQREIIDMRHILKSAFKFQGLR